MALQEHQHVDLHLESEIPGVQQQQSYHAQNENR